MHVRSALGFARSIAVYRLNVASQMRLRRLYRHFVRPGDLAFDVGAHVGDRIWALRALGCRVVAFEPQQDMMRFLRLVYANTENVVLEDCALGSAKGRSEMLVSRRNPTLSSLSENWTESTGTLPGFTHVNWDGRQIVRVETLDEMIDRYGVPAFCKIDVEGFEKDVLAGLSKPISSLSFEYLARQKDLAIQCLEQLASLGAYQFNISYREDFTLQRPVWGTVQDIVTQLHNLPARARSGDIYAQIQ